VIGAGTLFVVAEVDFGGKRAICKRLRPRFMNEPKAHAALNREARALEILRHPVVPGLIDRGSDAHGAYLIQTLHPGQPLRQLVEAFVQRDGQIPMSFVAAVAEAAFSGLAALHDMRDGGGPLGAAHGDLGPDHLLIGPARAGRQGRVGFVDFGMARARELPGDPQERGTLPFVAPEVARGEQGLDQAADTYALAATLLYAATGVEPCTASHSSAVLMEIAERGVDLRPLDRLSPPLAGALRRALEYDRSVRMTKAQEVLALLRPS
jgi:eukaryotic-like serine/threonine-protein kinase